MAATGGTPRQARRVVLAGGRGARRGRPPCSGSCSGIGVALGCCCRCVQRCSDTWFGPFEVPWPHLLGDRRLRPAQRVPGRRGPGLDRLAPGRRRRARRSPGRPRAAPALAAARARAARRRRRAVGVRRPRARLQRRVPRSPARPILVGARHDPAGAGRASPAWPGSPGGCRWCCGTPSATPPGTAPAPCPRWPPWRRRWPAWSRSASPTPATRPRTGRATCRSLAAGAGW